MSKLNIEVKLDTSTVSMTEVGDNWFGHFLSNTDITAEKSDSGILLTFCVPSHGVATLELNDKASQEAFQNSMNSIDVESRGEHANFATDSANVSIEFIGYEDLHGEAVGFTFKTLDSDNKIMAYLTWHDVNAFNDLIDSLIN